MNRRTPYPLAEFPPPTLTAWCNRGAVMTSELAAELAALAAWAQERYAADVELHAAVDVAELARVTAQTADLAKRADAIRAARASTTPDVYCGQCSAGPHPHYGATCVGGRLYWTPPLSLSNTPPPAPGTHESEGMCPVAPEWPAATWSEEYDNGAAWERAHRDTWADYRARRLTPEMVA